MANWSFWIDRGGTFTDTIALSPRGRLLSSKFLSVNPQKYDDAAVHSIRNFLSISDHVQIPVSQIDAIKIGTTVATNALLERKGARTVLVVTRGFEDQLQLGYQDRPDIFARQINLPEQLYEKVVSVNERILANGEVTKPLNLKRIREDLEACKNEGITSCAIILMHGYKFFENEKRIADLANKIGFEQVSVSHEVNPQIRFVERGDTTVLDAYLTPILRKYIDKLEKHFSGDLGHRLMFMQSNGGLASPRFFRGKDAVLSGPAGGVVGAVEVSRRVGEKKIIGFDMGGTSTDVCHFSGKYERIFRGKIAGVRLAVPMMNIHTVAAGGGSVLSYSSGRLQVGPDSAGAKPGPACYGNGGPPTITDANAVIGYISGDWFNAGEMQLDIKAARSGIFENIAKPLGLTLEQAAWGIHMVATNNMENALRIVSVERGRDPRTYAMVAFGGAGPLHASRLARGIGIPKVVIPAGAGVGSAIGLLEAEPRIDVSTTRVLKISHEVSGTIRSIFNSLEQRANEDIQRLAVAGVIKWSRYAYMRYVGQGFEVLVNLPSGIIDEKYTDAIINAFNSAYSKKHKFLDKDAIVEVVDWSLVATIQGERAKNSIYNSLLSGQSREKTVRQVWFPEVDGFVETAIIDRRSISAQDIVMGPAVIEDPDSTTLILPGDKVRIHEQGHVVIEVTQKKLAKD